MKKGIRNNETLWKNFNITAADIDEHIYRIYTKGREIEKLKKELSQRLTEAREMKEYEKKFLSVLEKRTIGIHADDENKLKEYGVGITNASAILHEEKPEKNFKAA